ncbi:MAG: phosphohistidine phosphatase SixA [Candidatus Endobugula sp.]|jgi:phosphohistidine phosphatase SixA
MLSLAGIFLMSFALSANVAQASDQLLWDLLNSGNHFVLIRHALAPGGGDPDNFTVDDCSTQRNLSGEGRAQASEIGDIFRTNGIASARVLSSRWCRCLETARLFSLGEVEGFSALNSFFQAYEREVVQTQSLTNWLSQQDLSVPTVLVTHQVNITALINVFPGSGEIILVKRTEAGAFELAGRYPTR